MYGYRIEVCPAECTSQVKYRELFLIQTVAVLGVGLYSWFVLNLL